MRQPVDDLADIVRNLGPVSIAVSGGVDSMTLAALTHRVAAPSAATMIHAVSPAVPAEATARVRELAEREGWRLHVLDAGEFDDPDYRRNPVNRCFYCKQSLYSAIANRIGGTIASGTNRDDLGEYRPGLDAARRFDVRHPYVEAGIGKSGVRALARLLGLGDLAELPASPCLSSRVETAIPIEPATLQVIHQVERLVASALQPRTVRCRVRATGFVIELDSEALERASAGEAELRRLIRGAMASSDPSVSLSFAPYRVGSAFVGAPS
jgi:uncharacterized protein